MYPLGVVLCVGLAGLIVGVIIGVEWMLWSIRWRERDAGIRALIKQREGWGAASIEEDGSYVA